MQVVIPSKSNRREAREYDRHLYQLRHLVENGFCDFKQWRGVATRYAKKATSLPGQLPYPCHRTMDESNLTTTP